MHRYGWQDTVFLKVCNNTKITHLFKSVLAGIFSICTPFLHVALVGILITVQELEYSKLAIRH